MANQRKVLLGTLAKQIRGVSYKPEDLHEHLDATSVRLLRANNIEDGKINLDDVVYVDRRKVSEAQFLRKGDILLCTSSGSKNLVGKAARFDLVVECTFGAFCKVVRPNHVEDADYLAQYFQSPVYRQQISSLALGANINNIRNEHVDTLAINWPDEKKRKNCVEILERINAIVTTRKKQLAALDELVKARFVEMFGEPAGNPMGWPTKPLLAVGDCKNGMNFHREESGVEIHCLGVGDFQNHAVFRDTTVFPLVSLNEMPSKEFLLQDGDIVFVRSNGNKALVGRSVAVYPGSVPTTFSGFCIRFRPSQTTVNTTYLLRVLKTDSMRAQMAGRGANIQNLNQQILSTLKIPLPPLSLQARFASFVARTEKLKATIQRSLAETQRLFDSQLQEHFG